MNYYFIWNPYGNEIYLKQCYNHWKETHKCSCKNQWPGKNSWPSKDMHLHKLYANQTSLEIVDNKQNFMKLMYNEIILYSNSKAFLYRMYALTTVSQCLLHKQFTYLKDSSCTLNFSIRSKVLRLLVFTTFFMWCLGF